MQLPLRRARRTFATSCCLCICLLAGCQAGTVAGTSSPSAASTTTTSPAAGPAAATSPNSAAVAGLPAIKQSGSGWPGDVNVASTSANYEGLTIDQLLATKSGIGQALVAHPAVVAAIRQVNQETQVPTGLLAGVIYQESGFDVAAESNNPDPTPEDAQDVGLCQCPQSDFTGDGWKDPVTNIDVFARKYFLPDFLKTNSWGIALRNWNSGEALDPNRLNVVDNNTDANYLTEILATHCLGLD